MIAWRNEKLENGCHLCDVSTWCEDVLCAHVCAGSLVAFNMWALLWSDFLYVPVWFCSCSCWKETSDTPVTLAGLLWGLHRCADCECCRVCFITKKRNDTLLNFYCQLL